MFRYETFLCCSSRISIQHEEYAETKFPSIFAFNASFFKQNQLIFLSMIIPF